jgi:hypothetical protein
MSGQTTGFDFAGTRPNAQYFQPRNASGKGLWEREYRTAGRTETKSIQLVHTTTNQTIFQITVYNIDIIKMAALTLC